MTTTQGGDSPALSLEDTKQIIIVELLFQF